MLGLFLAGFDFSFSTFQSFLQCLLWPELTAAGSKPLEDAEVGLGLTWKCQGGVFRSLPLAFRKMWIKGRSWASIKRYWHIPPATPKGLWKSSGELSPRKASMWYLQARSSLSQCLGISQHHQEEGIEG